MAYAYGLGQVRFPGHTLYAILPLTIFPSKVFSHQRSAFNFSMQEVYDRVDRREQGACGSKDRSDDSDFN